MANNNPNLVMNVGANTSNFREGMGEASESLNEFAKKSEQTFSEMGGDIDDGAKELKQLRDQFGEVGAKIVQMSGQAGEALGKVLGSLGEISSSVASLGIAAAVATFKLLNEEAEAFRSTVEGANLQLMTQAYLDTYRRFMHETTSEVGRSVAEAEAEVGKWFGKAFQSIKTAAVTALVTPSQTIAMTVANAGAATAQASQVATQKTEELQDVFGEILNLQNQQVEKQQQWRNLEAEITRLKREASSAANTTAQRSAAIAEATRLTNQLYNEQHGIQLMIADLSERYYGKTAEVNNLYEQADGLLTRRQQMLDDIDRIQASVTRNAQKEAEAWAKTAEKIAVGVARMQEFATFQIEMGISDESRAALAQFSQVTIAKPIEVPVRLETEEAEQQILDLSETIQSTIVEAISGMAESIGELLGNAINGEGGMAEFGQDVLSMIGTFAEKFGKVLVAYGAAVLAFESAFENPYAAIAAGAGLIVLGAMVKQIASNMSSSIGSGASSQSSYVASSGSYGAGGYSNSTLQVEVTGTLTANGSQLVAVLNNENNRTNYTT